MSGLRVRESSVEYISLSAKQERPNFAGDISPSKQLKVVACCNGMETQVPLDLLS